jgi:hypothetical protein
MQTLAYGYKLPEDGDKGSVFWDALEDDITQLNDHTHNGSNSALLTSTSVTATTQSISSASWAHQGGGTYRQTVTMPANIGYETHAIQFRNNADGRILYLSTEKVSGTSYYVYINDNTITVKAFYV